MQLRVVTIVCAAVTAVELGVVVVRWTACSTPAPAPPPPVVHFAPADAAGPAPATKSVPVAELAMATFDHQFLAGEAIVPFAWPDGFTSVGVRAGLVGAVRIETNHGAIDLHDMKFTSEHTMDFAIRSGNKLVIDYDDSHEKPPWHGKLDCALAAKGGALLRQIQTAPPLADFEVVERVRDVGELRSHWSGAPIRNDNYGYLPLCLLDVGPDAVIEEQIHVPMPPVKGQYFALIPRESQLRVRVNDSQQIQCEMGSVHLVAFDHVPATSTLATDTRGNWIVARIPESTFGVTCTRAADVRVGYGMTDLKCTLDYDTLKCPGR